MPKKAVTIRDVARRAGVSVATASRALNGKQVVHPETRDRILAVMEELGFAPSPAARRLSLGRTLTVGVVVSFLTRPQAAERIRGVDAVLADSEFDLVIYNVESVQKRDHYLGTLAQSQRTDGLLVMSLPPSPDVVAVLGRAPVPVVFIDVHTPSVAAMPRVIGDDVAGGALAAQHLMALGHRSIGFIGDAVSSPFGFTSSTDREAGFTRELASSGVVIPPHWFGHGAHGRYEARALAGRMLNEDDRPTAIFAASDEMAIGCILAARDLGMVVPRDVSIIGIDDYDLSDFFGLSTVAQFPRGQGEKAVEILMEQLEPGPDAAPAASMTQLPFELRVRSSTARPPE
jgi:DNA-binding LacI/PurR family transcriptional regulator